jgi:SAM-dependent methyltransferase
MAEDVKAGSAVSEPAGAPNGGEELSMPPAAKVPGEALSLDEAPARPSSEAAEQAAEDASGGSSDSADARTSGRPSGSKSLVPLPEGYAASKKRSSIPPGRLSNRARAISDPAIGQGARRSSRPPAKAGASEPPRAAQIAAQAPTTSTKAAVVMPMRIIDVKRPSGNPAPVAPAAVPSVVARAPEKPQVNEAPDGDSAQAAPIQTVEAGTAVGVTLAGVEPASGAVQRSPVLAPEAPTPPESPAAVASRGERAPIGAEAPTPPETPALRRELLASLQAQQGVEQSVDEAPPFAPPQPPGASPPGPPPSRARAPSRVDPSEAPMPAEGIEVTVESPDALEAISEDELTEVEAVSEREPERKPRRRLPPRPPPRTSFTDGSSEDGKRRQWWEELWSDDFLRADLPATAERLADEVDFIEQSLAVERGGVVLDLACGSGEHSVALAQRGYAVVGYDLSVSQLARAGEFARRNHQQVSFLQGDVREMSFEQMFDGVYCWNASFGFFEEERNLGILSNVLKALKPGGSFLLDIPNRDFVVRQQPMQSWFEGDNCVCMDDMYVDFITSRLAVKRTVMLDDGRNREWHYSLRLYSLHELGKMLHDTGFRVTQISGDIATPDAFLGGYSPRVIIQAIKPAVEDA